ncbi:unnamed protein product [Danaus chrysippus]|uniref:(African queen) hypothetical protein n=1 Tax=Danaus chrysippus TaxID=151541 RepID=A0A8J2W7G3_9NEOP|nr:unnamed protein product [Danaus chrysippus]
MAKRHVYKGSYTKCYPASLNTSLRRTNMIKYIEAIFKYLCAAYRTAVSNYLPIVTVVIVITLSLLLPNKVNKNNELKEINQVLGHMTDEVKRAEVACLTASDEVQCLRHSICNQETETMREQRDLSVCTSRDFLTTQSAPIQNKKIGFFRRFFPQRNVSRKEIAIMSIVYTESMDAKNKLNAVKTI